MEILSDFFVTSLFYVHKAVAEQSNNIYATPKLLYVLHVHELSLNVQLNSFLGQMSGLSLRINIDNAFPKFIQSHLW